MNTIFKVNGKPFFAIGGQAHNTTTYSDKELEIFWNALKAIRGNVAEIPIYWEAVEPVEGQFDFSSVDNLIRQARSRDLKLVLLWFGTWKNGGMKYAPTWVKKDTERFRRVISHDGSKLFVLSSHCIENFEADKKAFLAVLRHIREADGKEKTVLAVQVENEPGIGGRSYRDFGETAEKEYRENVPADFVSFLRRKASGPVYEQWKKCGEKAEGCWEELFGKKYGSECFTARSIACYINSLARAGKAVYELPMYVNVALDGQPWGWNLAGTNYTGAGPVIKLYDLWKFYTPNIDLLAPDIYFSPTRDYLHVCENYSHEDNPLFVPESSSGMDGANFKNIFYAVGKYNAIGYFSFGIEDMLAADGTVKPTHKPLVDSYRALSAGLPLLVKYHKTGKIHEIVQEEAETAKLMEFGSCWAKAEYEVKSSNFLHRNIDHTGERARGLVIEGEENEFFLLGSGFTVFFTKKDDIFYSEDIVSNHASYLAVEEGHFDGSGKWIVDRIRTGDESDYGIWVYPENGVVRVQLCE